MPSGLTDKSVTHKNLLLDPNNYRFQDNADFIYADTDRFHEPTVQNQAAQKLRDDSLVQLKNSILTNGLLAFDRMVVRPYKIESAGDELYLVIEGNRRLAAIRWIMEDHDAGLTVDDSILNSFENIQVIMIESDDDTSLLAEALLGIRHVSGIKEWGGYQRAKLVATLHDDHKLASNAIANSIGMSVNEVNRRYRAYKALQQMADDEDFAEYARADLYPIFHEALSLTSVKDWLGWDESSYQFKNVDQLEHFYALITPQLDEQTSSKQDAKLPTYLQVRELRSILINQEAKEILLDPSLTFFDALSVAKRQEASQLWTSKAKAAIGALNGLPLKDVSNLEQPDLELLHQLRAAADSILTSFEKLQK